MVPNHLTRKSDASSMFSKKICPAVTSVDELLLVFSLRLATSVDELLLFFSLRLLTSLREYSVWSKLNIHKHPNIHRLMMAAPATFSSKDVIASVLEEEDLSDEQVRDLLRQAEIRLREKAEGPSRTRNSTQSLPKLHIGSISQPYIRTEGGISRVDSSCLLEKDVRDLADQPRETKLISVEKKKLAEVCHDHGSHYQCYENQFALISIY